MDDITRFQHAAAAAERINADLLELYANWRQSLQDGIAADPRFGVPILVSVDAKYAESALRVAIIGQETFWWDKYAGMKERKPHYVDDWPFEDIHGLDDFYRQAGAPANLMWGYRAFRFGESEPRTRATPFWRFFHGLAARLGTSPVWTNLIRCDFENAASGSRSLLHCREPVARQFLEAQRGLVLGEISRLAPEVCLFVTGPRYDSILRSELPGIEYLPVDDHPLTAFARLGHPALPDRSFRIYHPGYLNRTGELAAIRDRLVELLAA